MDYIKDISNPLIKAYLEYVENTQSPRIFHIWSILTCVGAALGRRNYLPFGIYNVYPNMYSILTGPPGVKKSTAANIAVKLLGKCADLKFAPKDTAGRYQGLISAMLKGTGNKNLEKELQKSSGLLDGIEDVELNINQADEHCIFAVAPEWSSFIGINNTQFLTFLLNMWDGEDYEYQLKKESAKLNNPLMTMLGCSTPTSIANCIPAEAIGEGFMSRVVFIHSSRAYKNIPRPKALDLQLKAELEEMFHIMFYKLNGPFTETPDATEYIDTESNKPIHIDDHRFIYYSERRQSHLLKLAMCLCAGRLDKVITLEDLQNAQQSNHPHQTHPCLLYTSPSPRDRQKSRMPSSA